LWRILLSLAQVQKPGVGSLLKADLAFVSFAAKFLPPPPLLLPLPMFLLYTQAGGFRFLEFVNPDLARLSLADIMVLPAATALRRVSTRPPTARGTRARAGRHPLHHARRARL
jgi:hypothetical protein